MGGPRSTFEATRWSEMHALRGLSPEERKAALDELVGRYWKPVYCYLRRKGCDNEQAKDLTQGFFQEIVLGNRLVEQADEAKGRFRTFLLTALDRYVISVHRKQTAARRNPVAGMNSLDEMREETLPIVAKDMKPDEAFTYVWALQLLGNVLTNVREQCAQDGMGVHWKLFEVRVLDPIISGAEPVPLSELCRRLGVATPVKAENMIVTVRRRFQTAMRNRVREYVISDEEVELEIHDLMAILSA